MRILDFCAYVIGREISVISKAQSSAGRLRRKDEYERRDLPRRSEVRFDDDLASIGYDVRQQLPATADHSHF